MRYLTMYLAAPMQSWGGDCKFQIRTTGAHPTRSAITGILAAALGIERDNKEALGELRSLVMETLILRSGTRIMDFHTIGGSPENYPDEVRALCRPHTAEGKLPEVKKGTVVTKRWYLCDAQFGILISGPTDLLEKCSQALHNPVWGIWLGRKCCIPMAPVHQGSWESREQAIKHLRELSGVSTSIRSVREVEKGGVQVRDVPACFKSRTFTSRRVEQSLEIGED